MPRNTKKAAVPTGKLGIPSKITLAKKRANKAPITLKERVIVIVNAAQLASGSGHVTRGELNRLLVNTRVATTTEEARGFVAKALEQGAIKAA